MYKHLIFAALFAASFGGSILASATPASALYYHIESVYVHTGSVETLDGDDDDDDWWPF